MVVLFLDVFTAPCSGNYTFRLNANTTGSNDNLEMNDVVIVVTVYESSYRLIAVLID